MNEIKIGVVGNVNSAKSSTIGVLAYDVLDDGRGFARSKVLLLPHEQETGRTSNISKHFIKKDDGNFISLLDLAGHEKYLKTTLYGLSGHFVDYAIIIVEANSGVQRMTKEHLGIVLPLRIPFIVVVTKIDLAPVNKLEETMNEIQYIIRKKRSPQRDCRLINNKEDVINISQLFHDNQYKICPIFQVSNTTGKNIDLLKSFVMKLKPRFEGMYQELEAADNGVFKIYDKFNVHGVGLVISGYVRKGEVKVGDKMYLGPIYGDWKEVVVRSIHDNFRNNIDRLGSGESGCIAIKFTDKKYKINKKKIRKGVVLSNHPEFHSKFYADIYILSSSSTTIKVGYQPVINCSTVVQTAKICELDKEVIRGGERARVKMEFMHRPEYFEKGDLFIFREGNLRGFGKIVEILD